MHLPKQAADKSKIQQFQTGSRLAAWSLLAYSLACLAWGALPLHAGLEAIAAAIAILALAPGGIRPRGLPRMVGYPAAAAVTLLGVANGSVRWRIAGLAPEANAWAVAFTLLGISLLVKSRLPRSAITLDMIAGFFGYVVILERMLGVSNSLRAEAHPVQLAGGIAVFGLSAAWMTALPWQRPVGFFTQGGSASALMRRLLPITLLFPVILVELVGFQRVHPGAGAQLANWSLVLGVVAFGAALFWITAETLDRQDVLRTSSDEGLRASELRYRRLFEENPQPMWVVDAETLRFLAVNESACRKYGYTRQEFLWLRLPDIRDGSEENLIRDLVRGGELQGQLRQHRTKSGSLLEVEVHSHTIEWQGRPAREVFLLDVTERRRAEAQLRESEAQVRALLESTIEGIFAVDRGGVCTMCNAAAVRLLRLGSANELVGCSAHAIIHPSASDGTPCLEEECELSQARRQGVSRHMSEVNLWRGDGTAFPADIYSSPLYREGVLVGAVVSFVDVTERKSLQLQIQQAQKMEAIGRLAAGIAHDFNNLLTVINGYTEMLLRGQLEDPIRAKVTNINKAGARASSLTQQLLVFSRQQVMQPRVVNLNEALAEIEPMLHRVLGEDLTLLLRLAPDLDPVMADPNQMIQVVMNLAVNARDAMPNGGKLTIESANVLLDAAYATKHHRVTPGRHVMFAVTDTGTGMDQETLSHIFEPFFTTKPAGQGTGLGLATVFGIVQQSGGSIVVYSEPGVGTSMKVYLPSVTGAVEVAEPSTNAVAPSGGQERILAVEDEAVVRELLQEVLETAGYEVMLAEDPVRALALSAAYAGRIDLLITDVVMPGMNGSELAERITAERPDTAVIFISGYPEGALSHQGTLRPGVTLVPKPFTPDQLTRRVREVLDQRPAVAQPLRAKGADAAAGASPLPDEREGS